MGEKDIKEVAGIGEVLGQRFTEIGFDKVSFVMYVLAYLASACLISVACFRR